MKPIFHFLAAAGLALTLACCGIAPSGPAERAEDRNVTLIRSDTRSLSFTEPMVFCNSRNMSLSGRGVRVPGGTYKLEAEDAQYLYYRAPSALEYRVVIQGKTDQRFIPGGVAIGKSMFSPAATYADFKTGNQRQITRMLGSEFLLQENRVWNRNP
jgi:hypothetical protein